MAEKNDCVGDGAKRGEKRSSLEERFQICTPTAETLYGCPEAGERNKQLQALSKLFVCQSSLWAACGTTSCESSTSRWNSSAHLRAQYCSTGPLNSTSQVSVALAISIFIKYPFYKSRKVRSVGKKRGRTWAEDGL